MKNKNPTAEAVRKVASVFGNIKGKVAMHQDYVSRDEISKTECGTIACHGGHYLAANLHRIPNYYWRGDNTPHKIMLHISPNAEKKIRKQYKTNGYAHFHFGANMMATDLGFENLNFLKEWASQKDIWGNEYGPYMFVDARAFGAENQNDEITLADIHNHWMKIADRLEKDL